MSEVQIAIIDQEDTQITLAVPGVQGPVGNAIPAGGTTNQVLFKSSATNYDATWGNVTSAMITDLAIVNADVNASAAIAGSKISPDFGAQTIVTTGVHSAALGAAATPSITFTGDLNTGIFSPGADQLAISTNGIGRLFVDATGSVRVGVTASASNNYGVPLLSVAINSFASAHIEAHANPATNGSYFGMMRSRGTQASPTHLQSGDLIGSLTAQSLQDASSGFPYRASSSIDFVASATHSTTSLPTDILFNTADVNSTASTPRVRITSAGLVGIGTTAPAEILSVNSSPSNAAILIRTGGAVFNSVVKFNADDTNYAGIGLENTALVMRCSNNSTPTERARIDSSGRLLVGTSTSRSVQDFPGNGPESLIQIEATNSLAIMSIISAGTADASRGGTLSLGRHRNATVGATPTVVQSGDLLGAICFAGGDGTDMLTKGAAIACQVDGTPGANDMPGRLVFSTNPGSPATSPTERLRITSTGQVRLAGAGITFNGDTATANELDDYEEGTWTPAQGPGLTVVGAFSSIGRYTKIGNLVTVYAELRGATSIAVGAVTQMTNNLPFAHSSEMGSTGIATGISSAAAAASFISTGGIVSVLSLQAISGVNALSFTNTYRIS